MILSEYVNNMQNLISKFIDAIVEELIHSTLFGDISKRIKWFFINQYRSTKAYFDRKRVLRLTRRLIKENWETAETRELMSFTQRYNIEKKFVLGKLHFSIFRGIRGDLIEVKFANKNTDVISYVDQSHQYNYMLGVNDVYINITYERFLNAIQTVNKG